MKDNFLKQKQTKQKTLFQKFLNRFEYVFENGPPLFLRLPQLSQLSLPCIPSSPYDKKRCVINWTGR